MHSIPIRNLWLLMLYASELMPLLEKQQVAIEDNPEDLPDLVTEVFLYLLDKRLKRSLSTDYQPTSAIQSHLRGRLDSLKTESQQLLQRGQVACHYQHLDINTPLNAFFRFTLETSAKLVKNRHLKQRCQHQAQWLLRLGVTAAKPSETSIKHLRFAPHQHNDKQLVQMAQLLLNFSIPTEMTGEHVLIKTERDLQQIRYLYEKAIAGFYRVKLTSLNWKVKAQTRLNWPIIYQSTRMANILPNMQSDIILENKALQQRIMIDTKFTQILKPNQWRETLNEKHIYQIYAYLKSQTGNDDALSDNATGLLLYPAYGEMLDEAIQFQGHWIRFATVDLMAPAQAIQQQLLHLIQPFEAKT